MSVGNVMSEKPTDLWILDDFGVPSGKRLHSYGKSPFFMGKSTMSMAIFNSYVSHNQRVSAVSPF